jgi:hypothetical protein
MLGLSEAAVEDLRYLLGRGYGRISSVKFVGDKYLLDKSQRLMLYRGVYPPEGAMAHKRKLVKAEEVKGTRLAIDGFNVLWTVDGALKGRTVFMCDDGLVRDISAIHGSPTKEDLTRPLGLIVQALSGLGPAEANFVFDRLVSRSGELAKQMAQMLKTNSVKGGASTATSADFDVIRRGEIVSSSDSVIVDKSQKVFDLAAHILYILLRMDLPKV